MRMTAGDIRDGAIYERKKMSSKLRSGNKLFKQATRTVYRAASCTQATHGGA